MIRRAPALLAMALLLAALGAPSCAAPAPHRRAAEVLVTPRGEVIERWYWTTRPPDEQTDLLGLYDPDR